METKNPISHEFNLANNARLTNFNGWQMPTFYSSIIDEHKACRNHIGLFDVSHMGRWWVTGKDAESFLDHLISNDLGKLKEGRAIYSPMCNEDAGIVDDLIIYKYNSEKFLLVNNAGNHDIDSDWYAKHKGSFDFEMQDITRSFGQIAVQGPKAKEAVNKIMGISENIKYFNFETVTHKDHEIVVTATGYTGEQGYELYGDNQTLMAIWQELIDNHQAQACGLGSRDILRLEAGYCLHGNDISTETTPYEAGLEWTVKLDSADFIGKAKVTNCSKKLVGLLFPKGEKIIPRHGTKVFDQAGKEIGEVTSGNLSPILERGIALTYINVADLQEINPESPQAIQIEIRKKMTAGIVCNNWFYRNIRGQEISEFAKEKSTI